MLSTLKNASGRRCRGTGTPHQEKHTSKKRVCDFFGTTWSRAGVFLSETQYSRRENPPSATTTASGVHYYGYRYYSTELGRWVRLDPIAEKGGLNVYSLVYNNAVCYVDHLGLACQSPLKAIWYRTRVRQPDGTWKKSDPFPVTCTVERDEEKRFGALGCGCKSTCSWRCRVVVNGVTQEFDTPKVTGTGFIKCPTLSGPKEVDPAGPGGIPTPPEPTQPE